MNRKILVPVLGSALMLSLLPSAPALADESVKVSQPASTSDTGAWATVTVPVAQGLKPASIKGRVSTTATDGQLQLRVGKDIIKTLPVAQSGAFDMSLNAKHAAENGTLDVAVRWLPESREGRCLSVEPQQVELSQVQLQAAGEAKAPESVAQFFASSPGSVSIQGEGEASQAALSAVPALAAAFPSADIAWNAADADYTVAFELAEQGMKLALDRAGTTLRISGTAEQLAELDTVIRSRALTLAVGRHVDAEAAPVQGERWTPAEVMSFADLGATAPKLEGYGQSSLYIGVDEAQLGSSLDGAQVHLSGTHSAIPENTEAALNVYWNDQLVDSFVLDQSTALNADIQIPQSLVTSRNGLRLQLDAAAQGANCAIAGTLPVQVHLDGSASTVTPQYGAGRAAGFEMLPQQTAGEVGLALGAGTSAETANALATSLLASLQQASAVPLHVQNLAIEDVAGSPLSTVVVGGDAQLADELGAPLRLERFRTIESSVLSAGVGTEEPYAALQAFEDSGRAVLLAGGWSPDGTATDALYHDLADRVAPAAGGWSSLSRNLLVAQEGAAPVLVESNALIPQDSLTDDYRPYAWWAAGGVAALVLAGLAGAFALRRSNRRAKAQAAAEAAAGGPQSVPSSDER